MSKSNKALKKYIQHFSTRIPWKDNDYTGRIDDNPKYNVAAQVIPNISASRNLEFEENNKGKYYKDVEPNEIKSWITENAAFMSTSRLSIKMHHPYSNRNNARFSHFIDTIFNLEPYSFLLRPFSWTLIEKAKERKRCYNFYFDLAQTQQMLNWPTAWVSHGESQKGIFEYFFSGIEPENSLIFPYYKQVPFIEDSRRVIAGIGNIVSKIELHEYDSDGSSDEKNFIWETNVAHSIRNDGKNGFLMPYHEIFQYSKEHPDFDISSVTLFEPAGFREEFSYTAEWVSYDAAIDVLNQAKTVLENIKSLRLKTANFEWVNTQLQYVEMQLENVWNQRGVFPGLGTALSAFGVRYGFDIAHYIDTSENDLITELTSYFKGNKTTGDGQLDESLAEREDEFFGLIQDENKAQYFELLARTNLSIEQAVYAWNNLGNRACEIIENPYRLFELTRKEPQKHQITISQIDNAMFINPLVENKHPLDSPTKMRTQADKRRFRAMAIFVLEQAAARGHTLLQYTQIVDEIAKLPLDCKTDFQVEKIEGLLEFLQESDLYVDKNHKYIKLTEYQEYKEVIITAIKDRINKRLSNIQNWAEIVDANLKELQAGNEENDTTARQEKAHALKILEASKIAVLLGGAGTGKTATLGIFASSAEIKAGGVLALTPTGKARIQLENSFKKRKVTAEFMTIAQFLIRSGGFSWNTMTYRLPNRQSTSNAQTVIIDESSMLTENMFAGILKLVAPHAKRIIFTGDPNQLPPIGAGRPFVDLISYLKKEVPDNIAELNTGMRQNTNGDDFTFAQIFSDAETVNKNILDRVENNETDQRLKYIRYDGMEEFEKLFFEAIAETVKMESPEDTDGFNKSLGATKKGKYTNYNTGNNVEDWQVLSPTKFVGTGSYYLNNQIHLKYRQDIVETWNQYTWSKNKPQSDQSIVHGDKVISIINEERDGWDKEKKATENLYIANGEIGIMTNYPKQYGRDDNNDTFYKFMFGSFEGKVFSYTKSDFGGESSESKLELAYALTVHKSQGSGFGNTIVVINGKSSFLSKELLYTAFSRQKEKLIILSDLPIKELAQYANDWHSDTKQRYTDLFKQPNIIKIEHDNQQRYFEEKLIHKTSRGEMVRSKSEVIVANILDKLGIDYTYEKPLQIQNKMYIPDFTLRYQGKIAYLEHLGMIGNKAYEKHWKEKEMYYQESNISEEQGNLIITKDGLDGSLDSTAIEDRLQIWKNSNRT